MDRENQTYGRVEENKVAAGLARAGHHVRPIDPQRRVKPPPKVGHPGLAFRWGWLRKGREWRHGVCYVRLQDRISQCSLGLAREQIHAPWLRVEVAGRGARRFEDFRQQMPRHRIGPECPDRLARTDHDVEGSNSVGGLKRHVRVAMSYSIASSARASRMQDIELARIGQEANAQARHGP